MNNLRCNKILITGGIGIAPGATATPMISRYCKDEAHRTSVTP